MGRDLNVSSHSIIVHKERINRDEPFPGWPTLGVLREVNFRQKKYDTKVEGIVEDLKKNYVVKEKYVQWMTEGRAAELKPIVVRNALLCQRKKGASFQKQPIESEVWNNPWIYNEFIQLDLLSNNFWKLNNP